VKNTDSFVHRTGRTGRAGKTGLNICFAFKDDLKFIKDLEDNLNIKINIINNMDSFKTIGDEATGQAPGQKSEIESALAKEVKRVQGDLLKPREASDVDKGVAQLCEVYAGLDEENK